MKFACVQVSESVTVKKKFYTHHWADMKGTKFHVTAVVCARVGI